MLSVGLGEAPYFVKQHSIWENLQSLELYSKNGAHLDALRKAYQGNILVSQCLSDFEQSQ